MIREELKSKTLEVLRKFQPVSLAEIDNLGYGDRLDTKFAFAADLLPGFLSSVSDNYKILEIDSHRFFSYESLYYDTDNLYTYLLHHNRAGNRVKIRMRTYVDTHTVFLEVKRKNNRGRTMKSRTKGDGVNGSFPPEVVSFLNSKLTFDPSLLKPTLLVEYNRITLADTANAERVTIDMNLQFSNLRTGKKVSYPEVAIAEVKQIGYNRHSPIMELMHTSGVHTINLSKYCLGIVSCFDNVKYNRFKKKILRMKKISNELNISV